MVPPTCCHGDWELATFYTAFFAGGIGGELVDSLLMVHRMIAEWTYSSKVFSMAVVKRGLMIQHIEELPKLQKAYKSVQVSYQIVGCRNVESKYPYRCKFWSYRIWIYNTKKMREMKAHRTFWTLVKGADNNIAASCRAVSQIPLLALLLCTPNHVGWNSHKPTQACKLLGSVAVFAMHDTIWTIPVK